MEKSDDEAERNDRRDKYCPYWTQVSRYKKYKQLYRFWYFNDI